ncbi:MAG: hypothetical protein IJ744_05030 [Lachnospiraceae bacterium]|nr:hypothetical protein [Lachnospiraceae bacterium]
MFRMWGKIWKDHHLIENEVYENADKSLNRTRKVFDGVKYFSYLWNLQEPIWLDKNINEFKRHDRTRFTQDSFIEEIDFDCFEIIVIEEDEPWE